MIPIIAIAIVAVTSTVLGALSLRVARSTSDFLVASRSVRPGLNASAICGEYLSAGTFLGLAGLVMTFGIDMLWYPVGYTAGYVILLLLVAAPLRRFGAYTIPEFAQGRLGSPLLRRISAGFVLLIGWMYLLPQMKGAGITVATLTGAPYWVGVVLVAAIVAGNVAFGGMRGITFVQAFQYFVKVFALSSAAIVLLIVGFGVSGVHGFGSKGPAVRKCTQFLVPEGRTIQAVDPVGIDSLRTPMWMKAEFPDAGPFDQYAYERQKNPAPFRNCSILWDEGLPKPRLVGAGERYTFHVDELVVIPRGAVVPKLVGGARVDGPAWERPFSSGSKSRPHPLYAGYSLIVGTFLGTMGLPHILVRFYTNPDGPATRKTIVVVVSLLAIYYVWPPVYGVLGRMWAPDLLLTGKTDAVVLLLPQRMVGGLGGQLLTGVLAAGAFAAFLSTASGLLISVAGAISHDLARSAAPAGTSIVRRFRQAAVIAAIVAAVLGLRAERFEINVLVGWAFAIAASSFCPLLILGVWWRRFTWVGAMAGMLAGGGAAAGAIFTVMLGPKLSGWPAALLAQPAAWTVPIAFLACIAGSLLSPSKIPVDTHARLARMHSPERLVHL
jgi:cation/acetate symporter